MKNKYCNHDTYLYDKKKKNWPGKDVLKFMQSYMICNMGYFNLYGCPLRNRQVTVSSCGQ